MPRLPRDVAFKFHKFLQDRESFFSEKAMSVQEIADHCTEQLSIEINYGQVEKGIEIAGFDYAPATKTKTKKNDEVMKVLQNISRRLDSIEIFIDHLSEDKTKKSKK